MTPRWSCTPAHVLRETLEADPEAARELLIVIAERLREADRRRLEYTTQDTLARVATRLLELTERFGEPVAGGLRSELPLVQEDLARWCGASREATVKALRTLRRLGVVSTGRRTVTVHDASPRCGACRAGMRGRRMSDGGDDRQDPA